MHQSSNGIVVSRWLGEGGGMIVWPPASQWPLGQVKGVRVPGIKTSHRQERSSCLKIRTLHRFLCMLTPRHEACGESFRSHYTLSIPTCRMRFTWNMVKVGSWSMDKFRRNNRNPRDGLLCKALE